MSEFPKRRTLSDMGMVAVFPLGRHRPSGSQQPHIPIAKRFNRYFKEVDSMATQSVAKNVTTDGDSDVTPAIVEGQYLLGMSGDFDGATVELFITLGPADEVPIGISYTAPSSDIIWLPRCTAFVRTTGAGANTDVNVAIGELSSQMHRFN